MKAGQPAKLAAIRNYFLAFFACLTLTSCHGANGGAEPGTFRINLGAEPPGLDWNISTDSTSFDVVCNLMVGLTQYTPHLKCDPAVASSWEVLDGGRRYVFHLRRDVFWTDGKPVVAGDFAYGWKRLLDPKTGAEYAYLFYDVQNAYEYNTGKLKDPALVGVKALDDYTLEVRLKKPAAYFLYLTAICPSYPQRRDVIERWGDRWTEPEHIVTNGPFKLSKWAHEYKIELVANPRFFEGPPAVQTIKMFMVNEQSTAFALYENDQLDYVDNRSFSTSDVERYHDSPQYHNVALLRNNYIGFNVKKKPFDDVRVRQAFTLALDRSAFPRILRRHEEPSQTWIPATLLGYSKDSRVQMNVVRARQLLAEAGYPGGKGFPVVDMLYPSREDTQLVCEQIQDQLKRNLGVTLSLQNEEWKMYLEHLHRDPPPIFRENWGADYPDPETFMNIFCSGSGNNHTLWSNATYDDLVHTASCEQDPKVRADLYARADKMLCVDQAAIAPCFLATQNTMVKPWVKGLEFNSCDIQFFNHVRIVPQ
jgi:oligopeptide transport system substrate-binding protein